MQDSFSDPFRELLPKAERGDVLAPLIVPEKG
jgi:hypothetical protein